VRVFLRGCGELADALGAAGESEDDLRHVHTLCGSVGAVRSVDLDTTLDVVVSGDDAGVVGVYSLRRGEFVRLINVSEDAAVEEGQGEGEGEVKVGVRLLRVGKDGEFVCLLDDGTLAVWTVNGACVAKADAGTDVTCLEIAWGGQFVLLGTEGGLVKVFSFAGLREEKVLDFTGHDGVCCFASTLPDNSVDQYLLVGHVNGNVSVVTDPKHRLICLDDALQTLPWFE
jgi:WD40 repeat protein